MNKNQQTVIDELIEKISHMTYTIYVDFLNEIDQEYNQYIQKAIDIITKIDYIVTIAKVAREYNSEAVFVDEGCTETVIVEVSTLSSGIVNICFGFVA